MSTSIIAFFGATGGCGLFALKRAVAAGHTCIALCRTPAKLDAHFPEKPPNLIVKAGNAHDLASVSACLISPSNPGRLVDGISFSIGGQFNMLRFTIDDPDVCKKGMATLLEALSRLRLAGAEGQPLVTVISTTGITRHQRDVPLLFMPMYHCMLKVPHADKKIMEQMLVASSERWVLVRPSLLTDGEKPDRPIRVGIEDPSNGVEKKEVGYFISREAVGRWIYENQLRHDATQYEGKAVSITW